jgi:hypothetical protein
MVLAFLHVPLSYNRIIQILGTTAAGTPFRRLERLHSSGVKVVRGEGSLLSLQAYVTSGFPLIVDVHTAELPYWQVRTDIPENEKATAHAVVVVGIEGEMVYLHDPDMDQALQVVNAGDFELAWLMRDYRYAVLQK